MKQKKQVYIFLMIAISFTLFLPVLNIYMASKNTKTKLMHFTQRQLFSTDNLESIINYSVYKTFNFSLNEHQVIAGEDGFFFLGNRFGSILDKMEGTFSYEDKDIEAWSEKLKKLQGWYEKQGIKFIIAIAPNKHTIYNDKLPKGMVYKEGATATDTIVKASLEKGIHILNLKKALREKKAKQLYFYTDTHWNSYGASIGYRDTIQFLNSTYGKRYDIPQYTMKEKKSAGGGDLTNLLKINQFLTDSYEKNYDFILKKKSKLCYGEITKANKLKKCTPGDKNKFNQYSINEDAPNKEKLLYLCDSFGTGNSKLYEETFHTVWRFHISYTKGRFLVDFIQKHKPDIVIYQVVERDLGNNTVIDDLP